MNKKEIFEAFKSGYLCGRYLFTLLNFDGSSMEEFIVKFLRVETFPEKTFSDGSISSEKIFFLVSENGMGWHHLYGSMFRLKKINDQTA